MLDDALAVQDAGAFAVVMEMVPGDVAAQVTQKLAIPTIGIGAGAGCDGQVLVWQDAFGLRTGKMARFVKQYADLHGVLLQAARDFDAEVKAGVVPRTGAHLLRRRGSVTPISREALACGPCDAPPSCGRPSRPSSSCLLVSPSPAPASPPRPRGDGERRPRPRGAAGSSVSHAWSRGLNHPWDVQRMPATAGCCSPSATPPGSASSTSSAAARRCSFPTARIWAER